MNLNTIYNEKCLDTLRRMPDNFLDCIVTSPPYWGLRDYGHADQLGLEETPEQYVENMVEVFRECRRVLKETGTLWLNLGDSFLPGKQLGGIPWRVAFALQADGWYLRSDIIWHKPNPMPESVTDRPTKSHEYIFLLTKSARYYYDVEAVKETKAPASIGRERRGNSDNHKNINGAPVQSPHTMNGHRYRDPEKDVESSRNRRTVWTIQTQPYSGAHFAVFPPDLIKPCVLAGSPEKVCECCGMPWERVVEREPMEVRHSDRKEQMGKFGRTATSGTMTKPPTSKTTGWQKTCSCQDSKGTAKGLVYDPFGGSGTTAQVAATYGRNWILSELNPEYIPLINERMKFSAQLQIF